MNLFFLFKRYIKDFIDCSVINVAVISVIRIIIFIMIDKF